MMSVLDVTIIKGRANICSPYGLVRNLVEIKLFDARLLCGMN